MRDLQIGIYLTPVLLPHGPGYSAGLVSLRAPNSFVKITYERFAEFLG
jgi:hypothetical protein